MGRSSQQSQSNRTPPQEDVMQAACMDICPVEPDPALQLQEQVRLLELERKELECCFLDGSFFTQKGVILQFINNNCAGATSLIGGLRLALTDIRKVPAYLDRHSNRIKYYAVKCLDRHIRSNQCITGAGERLNTDHYGISYSLASVSQRGMMLNPSKRQEAPLFYAMFPGLVEPTFLANNPDGTDDYAHVVNVFIHLMPAAQRRCVYLQRLNEKTPSPVLTPAVSPAPSASPKNAKRLRPVHFSANTHMPNNGLTYRPTPRHLLEADRADDRISALEKEVKSVKAMALPNPPLPAISAPPIWKQDGSPDLPIDL